MPVDRDALDRLMDAFGDNGRHDFLLEEFLEELAEFIDLQEVADFFGLYPESPDEEDVG
jgi:hypothetical protein